MDMMDLESLAAIERDHDNLLPDSDFHQTRRVVRRKPPQRRELTLADKVELIKCYESSAGTLSVKSVANKFCISKTAALGIIKKKEEHLKQYSLNAGSDRRRVNRHCKFQELNSCTWKWYCVARLKQLPVTGSRLQEKARRFATRLGVPAFKASNGWLESFKRCYNISQLTSRSISRQPDILTSNFDWTSKLPRITLDFDSEDILACKAVTLYFRALPRLTTLERARRQAEVGEEAVPRDECLTLLLCCSATGEKMTPWVVASDISSLNDELERGNLVLRTSPDATLTRDVFAAFLDCLNERLRQQCRKPILFLDHMFLDVPDLSHVVTHFFPINIAANSNPIDLGIESFVKAHYRRNLLRSLTDEPGRAEFWSAITLADALSWVGEAWDAMDPDLVLRCFGDAGFTMRRHVPPSRETDTIYEELATMFHLLYADNQLECATVADYVTFDRLTVNDNQSEDDWEDQIVADILMERGTGDSATTAVTVTSATVASPQELLSVNLETDEEDDENGTVHGAAFPAVLPGSELSHDEVMEMVEKLKNFAAVKESSLVPIVESLWSAMEVVMLEKAKANGIVSDDFA